MEQSLEQKYEKYQQAVFTYYQTEEAIMSDFEFDELKEELEANGYDLSTVEDVEVETVNTRQKLSGTNNMLSLKKVQVKGEKFEQSHYEAVRDWLRQSNTTVNDDTEILVGWKLDGCAIKILFNETTGEIEDLITRGNFSVKAKMLSVARRQHRYTGSREIRCEALMSKSVFEEKNYSDDYQNPRNLVSGILNDQNVNDLRKTDIVLMRVNNGIVPSTVQSNSNYDLSYDTIKLKELPAFYTKYNDVRKHYDFPTDGLVVYLPETHELEAIGKYPLHSIAIKFPPVKCFTEILDIKFNCKKSGEWIPKAILKPVDLDGSTIRNTLCFNIGWVREHGAYPGAIVEIGKNGDIIPYIQRVITKGVESRLSIPTDSVEEGIHLYAPNSEQVIRERFIAGCMCMGFKNFGYAWFNGLGEICKNDIINLFDPTFVNMQTLSGTFGGQKKNNQLLQYIYELKTKMTIFRLLRYLQIPNLGPATAKQIAFHYSGLEMKTAGLEKQLIESCTIGEYATRIHESIERMKSLTINIELEKPDAIFDGITFEMTGSPKPMFQTKEEFCKMIPKWQHAKLDKTTTYLVTDDLKSTSSKMAKARKCGAVIVTYAQALDKYKEYISKLEM